MSLSPASSSTSPIALHNGGNNSPSSVTISVTFTNPGSGTTFTVTESGNGGHLTITKSGNNITIATNPGSTNRGLYSVIVTPSSGCGAAQTIYVNVAK